MASYDRRLLVPYLRDVCSIELLLAKLQKEYNDASYNAYCLQKQLNNDKAPEKTNIPDDDANFFLKVSVISFVLAVVFLILGGFWIVLVWIFGGIFVFSTAIMFEEIQKAADKKAEIEEYNRKLAEYNSRNTERKKTENRIQAWTDYKSIVAKRIREVEQLREKTYSANIIPKRYRNMYAAHYLYEYFSSSQECDLDRIIQTFVLEEIKLRLDKIIAQQTQMMLNQRYMMARQEESNKIAMENHQTKMKELALLNENAEKRNQYLSMINANLVVSNYFAYHDYIRN